MQSEFRSEPRRLSPFIIGGLLAVATLAPATGQDTAKDTYTWSAELVGVDGDTGTVTVQSRFVSNPDAADLRTLESGDRAMLAWSGITTAAGIRSITRGTQTEIDRLTLPIEFVSAEHDDQYVRFRVPVPSDDLAKLQSLSPGQWITATSPHRGASWEEAVVDARPYNDVG